MSRPRGQKKRHRKGDPVAQTDIQQQGQAPSQKKAADPVQKVTASPVQPEISSSLPPYLIDETLPLWVQGITVHALWQHQKPVPNVPPKMQNEIGIDRDETGLWTILRLAWRPASDREDTPRLNPVEAEQAIVALFQHLRAFSTPPSPQTTSFYAPPTYLIISIHKIIVPRPGFYSFLGKKQREAIDASRLEKQEIVVEYLQQLCHLTSTYALNEWRPQKFRHYDRLEHRQGWLVMTPTHALLAAVGSEQVLILADQIQPVETDSSRLCILPEHYYHVLARIAQWVSNQDSFLAVDRLQGLIDSSEKSLDGQVLLNLALATIGILIAFFPPGQDFQTTQIVALSCLVAASVAFWGYARRGARFFLLLGWLCGLFALLSIFWTRLMPWLEMLWSSIRVSIPHS